MYLFLFVFVFCVLGMAIQSVTNGSAHTSDESVSQCVDQLVCALPDSVGPILANQVSLGIFFRSRIKRETFNSSPYLEGQLVPSHLVPQPIAQMRRDPWVVVWCGGAGLSGAVGRGVMVGAAAAGPTILESSAQPR